MTYSHPNVIWYDRVEIALEACQRAALSAGDIVRARRALMLGLWANDRAEMLAERYFSPLPVQGRKQQATWATARLAQYA